ncbi:MAG: hypothetical protein ABJQ29_15580 [Luteolibacter sp.]
MTENEIENAVVEGLVAAPVHLPQDAAFFGFNLFIVKQLLS